MSADALHPRASADTAGDSEVTGKVSVRSAALRYLRRGLRPIPVRFRTKIPNVPGWQKLEITAETFDEHFTGDPQNIGILIGKPSQGAMVIDIDGAEALAAADMFLPPTPIKDGRDGIAAAHWWYRADDDSLKTVRLDDPMRAKEGGGNARLVELLGTGAQVVVHPSTHPSGAAYRPLPEGDLPSVAYATLVQRMKLLGATALLARYWPSSDSHVRHTFSLALAGHLLTNGCRRETTQALVETAARIAGDEEWPARGRNVIDTATNFAAGNPITGRPTAEQFVDRRVLDQVAKWVGPHVLLGAGPSEEPKSRARDEPADAMDESSSASDSAATEDSGKGKAQEPASARPWPHDQHHAAGAYLLVTKGDMAEFRRQHTTRDGQTTWQSLANFGARIVADISEDDGSGQCRRQFTIEVFHHGRRFRFDVAADRFRTLSWVTERLPASAIVYPGQMTASHVAAAIQMLSTTTGDVVERRVYTHTGWREHEGQPVYLHAGGAIGAHGPAVGIEAQLAGPLARFYLPEPPEGEELKNAIRASLSVLKVAPLRVTAVLLGAAFRAPIADCDFAVFLAGRTGAGKSELAALVAHHYGPGMDREHLPSNFSSTANAVAEAQFRARHAVLVIDDYLPLGSAQDQARQQRDADRIFRGQGNQAGRQRMNADGALRPERPARCLTLATGEDVPRGQSLRARMVTVEVGANDVNFTALSDCQAAGAAGEYAKTMAAFIRHLAAHPERRGPAFTRRVIELRNGMTPGGAHRRTATAEANLAAAWEVFVSFAVEHEALSGSEADALLANVRRALRLTMDEQARQLEAADPVALSVSLLQGALTSGRAHIASTGGSYPKGKQPPGAWGWRLVSIGLEGVQEWRASGDRIGWVHEDSLYLEPTAAVAVLKAMGRTTGDEIGFSAQRLAKLFKERGLLLSTDRTRETLTIRRQLDGAQRKVLHLAAKVFASTDDEPDKPDTPEDERDVNASVSGSGPGNGDDTQSRHAKPDTEDDPDSAPHINPMDDLGRQGTGAHEDKGSLCQDVGNVGSTGDAWQASTLHRPDQPKPMSGWQGGANDATQQPSAQPDSGAADRLAAKREAVLSTAAVFGWPKLPLNPPVSVLAGEEHWRIFVAQCTSRDLDLALARLSQ